VSLHERAAADLVPLDAARRAGRGRPVSLHAQLIAELDRIDPHGLTKVGKALRAVVELHAPVLRFEGAEIPVCRGCDKPRTARRPPWPCRTVQAIARELGIEAGEGRG
jgi:hypothetical protein